MMNHSNANYKSWFYSYKRQWT